MPADAAAYDNLLAMGRSGKPKTYSPGAVSAYLDIAVRVAKVQDLRAQKMHDAAVKMSLAVAYAECAKKYPKHLLMKSSDRKRCEVDAAAAAPTMPAPAPVAVARSADPYADFARLGKQQHEEVQNFIEMARHTQSGHKQLATVLMLRCIPELALFAAVDLEAFQTMLDASDIGALHSILSVLNKLQSGSNFLTAVKTKQATITAIMKAVIYVRGVFGADQTPEQMRRALQRVDPVMLAMFRPVIKPELARLLRKGGGGSWQTLIGGDVDAVGTAIWLVKAVSLGWMFARLFPTTALSFVLLALGAVAALVTDVLMAIPNLISFALGHGVLFAPTFEYVDWRLRNADDITQVRKNAEAVGEGFASEGEMFWQYWTNRHDMREMDKNDRLGKHFLKEKFLKEKFLKENPSAYAFAHRYYREQFRRENPNVEGQDGDPAFENAYMQWLSTFLRNARQNTKWQEKPRRPGP
jgi:hypothetical protein